MASTVTSSITCSEIFGQGHWPDEHSDPGPEAESALLQVVASVQISNTRKPSRRYLRMGCREVNILFGAHLAPSSLLPFHAKKLCSWCKQDGRHHQLAQRPLLEKRWTLLLQCRLRGSCDAASLFCIPECWIRRPPTTSTPTARSAPQAALPRIRFNQRWNPTFIRYTSSWLMCTSHSTNSRLCSWTSGLLLAELIQIFRVMSSLWRACAASEC